MKEQETNEQDGSTVPDVPLRRTPSELASIWSWQQTDRLTLRRLLPTDGPAMFAVHSDPATYRYSPARPHPDLSTSEEMLQALLQGWDTAGFGYWAVTLVRDAKEQVIGFGGVEQRVWREREVLNLYYRLTPVPGGRGTRANWRRGQ